MKKITLCILLIISAAYNLPAQLPGTLNPAFSENGWDTIFGNNNGFEITKALIQPDEKLLVCAEANFANEGHQAVIIRYNADGTLDAGFGGGDGMVRSKEDAGINLYTRAAGMALQSNGKIVVAGDQFYNSERIFRLNQDGTLDATFGINGVIDVNRPNSEFIYHVAVQSDDKIIVCGKESRLVSGGPEPHVFLWRFTPDGAMDMSFGNAGVVSYNSQAWLGAFEIYLVINDLIVLSNDDILVNQSFTKYPETFVMLTKMKSGGAFDLSFGVAGHSVKSVKNNDGNYTYSSTAVQENGSVLFSFTARDTITLTYTESICRVNAQGQNDPSLSINTGIAESFPTKTGLAVSGNLFYYYRKSDNPAGYSHDVLHCYDVNGNPSTGFGNAGIAEINTNDIPGSSDGEIAVAGNGNIYLCSETPDPVFSDNLLFLTTQVTGADDHVAVNDQLSSAELSAYPNPTNGLIRFTGFSGDNGLVKAEVWNSLGQTVFSKTGFDLHETIDLTGMGPGIYCIQITDGGNMQTIKLLKQ
jgi:uncharacterized delta-60 repeat protein